MPRQTVVLSVDAEQPDPQVVERAAAVLQRGGLVAFPTETVYGLGANALDEAAVHSIFAAKGRPANNPLIVHVADPRDVRELVADWPPAAERLAAVFWPGPLSLVLPKRPLVPDAVTAGAATVAVRMPDHRLALALIAAAGVPIAAPSANRSLAVSPTQAEHVLKGLAGRIDLLLDAGPTSGGLESTVLDLSRPRPRLLRPGLISAAAIEAVIGPLDRGELAPDPAAPLVSPGMLARHYAPRATLECVAADSAARVVELQSQGLHVGWMPLATDEVNTIAGVETIPMPLDPAAYASKLYAAMHMLDDRGVDRIVVELPPETPPWLAIHDRLRRAGAPTERDG